MPHAKWHPREDLDSGVRIKPCGQLQDRGSCYCNLGDSWSLPFFSNEWFKVLRFKAHWSSPVPFSSNAIRPNQLSAHSGYTTFASVLPKNCWHPEFELESGTQEEERSHCKWRAMMPMMCDHWGRRTPQSWPEFLRTSLPQICRPVRHSVFYSTCYNKIQQWDSFADLFAKRKTI